MSEVFRERVVESPVEPETAPQTPQPLESDELAGNETKASEPLTKEEHNLDIWEGLNRTKFVVDYFGVKEYADEFGLKMQTATIDKFIKGELEKRGYEKNIENYKSILQEIENEIGSSRLELFARIKKITGYASALARLYKAKLLKESFIADTPSRDS